MADTQKVTVEDLIDGAIVAGFQRGANSFLESLENQLRSSVLISESGDAHTALQQMIDESEGVATSKMSAEQLDQLTDKLSRVLR